MRSFILVAAFALPLLSKCDSSFGAALKRLELVADGSSNPPGDRIDFTIQFDPDESTVEVAARGFRISGPRYEIATPVGESSRKGILARQRVTRDEGSFVKQGSLVIPYSDWKLKKGTHRIAYEFILTVNGQVEFVRPTPLTEVVITDETRREISVTETTFKESIEARDGQFRVASEASSTDTQSTSIQTPVTEAITRLRMTAVEIPGEFLRSKIMVYPTAKPVAANDISSTDPETLANRWWRPLSEVESGKERRIWFATNRAPSGIDARKFTGDVAEQIQYGSCIVNIPVQNHRKGTLEMP